jgi:hypothetical protein
MDHFENEIQQARYELSMKTKTLEKHEAELPGIVENRFSQLQEAEAILEYLNIELKKLRSKHFRLYFEHYNKQLSSRDAEKYADSEPEVVNMHILVNEFALVRNNYLGIIKALEHKGYMMGHVTKLRVSGLDDAMIS